MQSFKIDANFESPVVYWAPNQTDQVHTGMLRVTHGASELLASPTNQVLSSELLGERFVRMGQLENDFQVHTIHGKTREGSCTLFDLRSGLDRGVLNFSNAEEIVAPVWDSNLMVMGLHLPGADAQVLESGVFYLSKVHQWLPKSLRVEFRPGEGTSYTPEGPLKIAHFSSLELSAEVECEVIGFGGQSLKNGVRIKQSPQIRVTPRVPQSLEWFLEVAPRLENFFTLFIGTSVEVRSIQISLGETSGRVILKRRRRKQKTDLQSWVRCDFSKISDGLSRWLAQSEEQQPVERTILGMLRRSTLFVEPEFLALAQALEAYGRLSYPAELVPKAAFKTKLKAVREAIDYICDDTNLNTRFKELINHANETSFGDRLRLTYDVLSPELSQRLVGDMEGFVRRVIHTRNYFTHLGIQKTNHTVTEPKKLFLMNQGLRAFLRSLMLHDLGIHESEFGDATTYEAQRWK